MPHPRTATLTLLSLALLLPLTAQAEGIVSGPWVQRVTRDEAWILWRGDDDAVVEWGTDSGLSHDSPVSTSSGEIHHARLAALGGGDAGAHAAAFTASVTCPVTGLSGEGRGKP